MCIFIIMIMLITDKHTRFEVHIRSLNEDVINQHISVVSIITISFGVYYVEKDILLL